MVHRHPENYPRSAHAFYLKQCAELHNNDHAYMYIQLNFYKYSLNLVLLLDAYNYFTNSIFWAKVALFFCSLCTDLTMDALLENGFSDLRCCHYSSNIT